MRHDWEVVTPAQRLRTFGGVHVTPAEYACGREDCGVWRTQENRDQDCPAGADDEPEPVAPRIEPKPAPAELGFDPVKWAAMPRAERRAVLRHAKSRSL